MIRARLKSGDSPVLSVSVEEDNVTIQVDSILRSISLIPTVKYLVEQAREDKGEAVDIDTAEEAGGKRENVDTLLDFLKEQGYSVTLKKGPFTFTLR